MQNDYSVISIARFIENSEERSSDLQKLINTFGCPQNSDVEHFLHFNAIDFSRRKMSGTHLVCNSNAEIVGYFSLAMKPIVFHAETMSGTSKKKIERIAKFDGLSNTYTASAFLIAQLGKNYNLPKENRIEGNELLLWSINTIKQLQYEVGGVIEFLECEDNPFLKNFYESNGFVYFDSRNTSDLTSKKLLQYYKFV